MRSGRRVRGGRGERALLDVKHLDSELGAVRVAIVVPKYSFTAVRRNKLKRRLRELARQRMLSVSASYDVLLRARVDAYDASFDALRAEVDAVVAQLTHRP